MKQNWIRLISYLVVSPICIFLAYYHHDAIVSEHKPLDDFSYIGTVATVIGLLITVTEVMQSMHISKSIRDEVKSILEKVKLIENASSISDCLAAIDEVNQNVANEDYKSALKSFQYLRKVCVKVTPTINIKDSNNKLSILNDIEFSLQKSTHTTIDAPLSKPQKTVLTKKILQLKEEFENINPARGSKNATD